jgi:cytochrome c biogenesis protein CcmG/thiol:disulfide interchange protein DsbE
MRTRNRCVLALIACLTLASGVHAALDPEESREQDGKPAPAFTVEPVVGKPVSLAALKGRPVLLIFFATWCPPCQSETEQMKKLLARHGASGLQVVGAAVDKIEVEATKPEEEKADVASFVKEHHPGYPVGIASRTMAKSYGFKGIPTTVVIGPDGKIARTFLGYHDAEKFEAVLKPLLR